MMSLEKIKQLRALTHFGLSDCKEALDASDNDIDKAVDFLKKKGLKKVDTIINPTQGEVRAAVFGSTGVIAEMNCETDFAARSDVFLGFVNQTMDLLNTEPFEPINTSTVSAVLGESVQLRRWRKLTESKPLTSGHLQNYMFAYNHPGGRVAVLLHLCVENQSSGIQEFAEHVAMHIAATSPLYIYRGEVPLDVVEEQRKFFCSDESLKTKSAEQVNKIVGGKLNKWYSESVLLEQESVVKPKNTIKAIKEEVVSSCGAINIIEFIRYERGEVVR